ncbi:MAG: hypothetical protein AB8H86_19355 [Polyangiales bacterium]
MDETPEEELHPWITRVHDSLHIQRYPLDLSDESIREFVDYSERFILALPTPYAWVVEIEGLVRAPRRQRQLVQDLGTKLSSYAAKHSAGTAIVAKGMMLRGLVKTQYLVKAPVFPVKVVDTTERGIQWAKDQLAARES